MLVGFGGLALFGFSYMNDIKEQKGRKSRKIFSSDLQTSFQKLKSHHYGAERVAAGDPEFVKFTHKKERAAVHH